jgi:polyhydroxyalkanoate synthesis regulator phasin
MEEMSIEKRVLLLGIYKKTNEETFNDVLRQLVNNGLFNLKDGKKFLKELKVQEFLTSDSLTFIGTELAKKIELEFKI